MKKTNILNTSTAIIAIFLSIGLHKVKAQAFQPGFYLEGKEWWFTNHLLGITGAGINAYFISDFDNIVNVEYPNGPGVDYSVVTVPGVMTILPIDPSYVHFSANGDSILDVGVRITSCSPGSLFYGRDNAADSDATHVIPYPKLGTYYIVTGVIHRPFIIIATEDNTNISILERASIGSPIISDTINLVLNRGQTCRRDSVTIGSELISDKPVAIFATHCEFICAPSCDAVVTQLPPYNLWSTRYITAQSIPRNAPSQWNIDSCFGSSADWIEIVSGPNPATVTVKGSTTTIYNMMAHDRVIHGVQTGSVSCFSPLQDHGEANTIITSDNPVMVNQAMLGAHSDGNTTNIFVGDNDPSSITVFPESTWQNEWIMGMPAPSTGSQNRYFTIIIKDEGTARTSLTMDGNPIGGNLFDWVCFPAAEPSSMYKYRRMTVTGGTAHEFKSDSAFVIYTSGTGAASSFGFIGGAISHPNDTLLLSATADSVCPGETTNFYPEISGGILPYKNYVWTGEDGFFSTNPNPQYVFPSGSGYNKVRVEVTDATGKTVRNKCGDPFYDFVVFVKEEPVIDAGNDNSICIGDSMLLSPVNLADNITVPFKSSGPPVSVPDNNTTGVSNTITVSGITPTTLSAGMLASVCIEIEHANTPDIEIYLTSPDGTIIELSSGNNPDACLCKTDYHKTCFSDGGGMDITAAHSPFTGFFIPENPLSTFDGEAVNGDWTINVVDNMLLNTGELLEWSLNFLLPDTSISYSWSPATGLSQADILNPTAFPTQTTTYYLTKTMSNSCAVTDSITVTVNPLPVGSTNAAICSGDSILLGGAYQTMAGNYNDTIPGGGSSGCDSVLTTVLSVNNCAFPAAAFNVSANNICVGNSITFNDISAGIGLSNWNWTFNGGTPNSANTKGPHTITFNAAGIFNITLQITGANGTDDTIVAVTVNPIATSATNITICHGDSILLGGSYQTTSGNYIDTIAGGSNLGCDSIITTTLTILGKPSTQNASICQGQDFTLPDGSIVSSSGTYIDTLIAASGCDSIVTTNLNITTATITNQVFNECEGFTIAVGANIYNTTGVFTDVLNGCDTIITDLTINPAPQITLIKTDDNCEENKGSIKALVNTDNPPVVYNWSNGIKDSSLTNLSAGTYILTIIDGIGCSNVDTIIINDFMIECDFFTLYIPNAFTPDDDGLNDFFVPKGSGFTDFEMEIYNLWGERIYYTSNIDKPWNGTFKDGNEIVQNGVYVYKIWMKDFRDETHYYVGNVMLLK